MADKQKWTKIDESTPQEKPSLRRKLESAQHRSALKRGEYYDKMNKLRREAQNADTSEWVQPPKE